MTGNGRYNGPRLCVVARRPAQRLFRAGAGQCTCVMIMVEELSDDGCVTCTMAVTFLKRVSNLFKFGVAINVPVYYYVTCNLFLLVTRGT